jgi:electron-transferring-flavoprotein dehydrogenase
LLLRASAIPTTALSASRFARPSHRTFATVSDADANPDDNDAFDPESVERATDEVDVCIVGGGPAGLSAAIRLKQLEAERGNEIRVVVLEKGSEVGE